jgi:hypothetical protein
MKKAHMKCCLKVHRSTSHPLSKTVALVALLAAAAFAANLSGKWSGSFRDQGADHDVPQFFILKQDGSKLTGSGGSHDGEQYPIENARIDGNNLTFDLTTGDWKFTYRLKVSSRQLEGDLELKSVERHGQAHSEQGRLKSGREWSYMSRQSRAPG